jgi:geranylgeranyl reductase family protein
MNDTLEADVIIVGSGPAGSAAAYTLASNNLKVILLEKTSLPRYKTCGGGLTYRAIKLLPIDIKEIIDKNCNVIQVNDFGAGFYYTVKRDIPIVAMTMRQDLDYFLLSSAKDAGVNVFENCKVRDLIIHRDKIELMTSLNRFYTKFVIAADGAASTIAKKAGWKETRSLIPALEYEVYVSEEEYETHSKFPRFDFGVITGGYGWVFPKKEHLSIGVASLIGKKVNLNKTIKNYLDFLKINQSGKVEKHGSIIPVSPRKDTFAKDGILLTGDAAGLADTLTAEGISYAIQSGQIAAKAIIEEKLNTEAVSRRYNKEISNQILPELRAGKILSSLVYYHPKLRAIILRTYGNKLSEIMADVVMGKRRYSELLSNPMNYIKLLRFWKFNKSINKNAELEYSG